MIIRVSGVRGFPGIVSDGEIDDMKGEIDECEKESKGRRKGDKVFFNLWLNSISFPISFQSCVHQTSYPI